MCRESLQGNRNLSGDSKYWGFVLQNGQARGNLAQCTAALRKLGERGREHDPYNHVSSKHPEPCS